MYHVHAKPISRAGGKSIVAKAAYNARERLTDEATGEVKNYTKGHSAVIFSGMFVPEDAPAWAHDRGSHWNHAEAMEHRKDSRTGREIELALPHELTPQQMQWLVTDFVRENFQRKGIVADVNIHAPGRGDDERNYHAHILLATREIDADGFSEKKALWLDKTATLEDWREQWAERGARMLSRAGFEEEAERFRYGHLDLAAQREQALERGDLEHADNLNHAPSKHQGPQLREMEARGIVPEVQERRAAEASNDNALRDELAELKAERFELLIREGELIEQLETERRPPSIEAAPIAAAVVDRQEPAANDDGKEAEDRGPGPREVAAAGMKTAAAVLKLGEEFAAGALALLGGFGESAPSKELVGARVADREQKQEQAREMLDWQRYIDNADFRAEVAAREQSEREQRAQDFTKQKDRDRDR